MQSTAEIFLHMGEDQVSTSLADEAYLLCSFGIGSL